MRKHLSVVGVNLLTGPASVVISVYTIHRGQLSLPINPVYRNWC